jgi:acyl carrier protein
MTDTSNALEAVYAALDQLNRQRPADRRLPKEPETRLIGPDGRLDSLGLVTFIVAVEEQVEDRFGKRLTLTDDRVLSSEDGPMHSVKTLAAFIEAAVGEEHGA